MAKETAEQKLLKIIEATDAQQGAPAAAGASSSAAGIAQQMAASVKSVNVGFQIPAFLNSILSSFNNRSSGSGAPSLGLREINHLLLAVIALGVLFLVFDFSRGVKYADQEIAYTVKSKSTANLENLIPTVKDIAQYVQVVSRRNIFQPYEKKEEVVEVPKSPEEMRRIHERAKDLKLVGISWLDSAESASALIENKNSGVTYFLRQGETINGVSIKKIFADSVILTADGDDLKLNL